MNKGIEQDFVKIYIDKKYQERVLFELSSPKKRTSALSRFSHDTEKILNQSVNIKAIIYLSELHESDEKVYIISWDKNDGMFIPLEDAKQNYSINSAAN